MSYIYVLECERNKWYVGKSSDPENRIRQHFRNYGPQWTKRYPPIRVQEVIFSEDPHKEENLTLDYMEKFGPDNVRGGIYSAMELTANELEAIKNRHRSAANECFTCGGQHFHHQCPKKKLDSAPS